MAGNFFRGARAYVARLSRYACSLPSPLHGRVRPRTGASADQDNRFGDKMKKLLKSTKFPPHFDTKVAMSKVQMDVMMPWVTQQVAPPPAVPSAFQSLQRPKRGRRIVPCHPVLSR